MAINDKNVNGILDYSKMLVDSLGDNVPTGIKMFQYLAFAGIISYYGEDRYKEVYEAFKSTPIFPITGSISDELVKSTFASDKTLRKIEETNPIAYYAHLYRNDRFPDNADKRLLLTASRCAPDKLVEAIVQEMNRAVNAVNKTYIDYKGGKFLRTGLAARNLFSGESDLSILEDSVNALQTGEIMGHIVDFANHDIDDVELQSAVSMIRYAKDKQYEGLGFGLTSSLIKPLYEEQDFSEVLKIARLDGEKDIVKTEFDSKVGNGAFAELSDACEFIEYGSCPEYVLDINGEKIKSLVKEYKSHK